MYWLEVAMPDGELMIWEHLAPQQLIFLRNNYMNLGNKVRTGKYKKVDNTQKDVIVEE